MTKKELSPQPCRDSGDRDSVRGQQISLYKSHFVPVSPQFCIISSLLMILVTAIYTQILQGTLILSGDSGDRAPKSLCGAVPSDVFGCGDTFKGAGTDVQIG